MTLRVEVWGHSNFDDTRNPDLRLNSPRGVWGPVRLGDAPLAPAGGWQIVPESPWPPDPASGSATTLTLGGVGQATWQTRTIILPGPVSPQGYVLRLDGTNLLGHLFVNGHGLGRCLFGPAAGPHLAGGPAGQFYVPAAWLRPQGQANRLSLYLLPTASDAILSRVDWTPVAG